MSASQRGVTADPRKAAAERAQKRVSTFQEQKAAAIQHAKDVREARKARAAEVESCYRQHTPRQVFHATEMIQCGDHVKELEAFEMTVDAAFDGGFVKWNALDMLVEA